VEEGGRACWRGGGTRRAKGGEMGIGAGSRGHVAARSPELFCLGRLAEEWRGVGLLPRTRRGWGLG